MGYALGNIRFLIIEENAHCRQLLRTIVQSVGARTVDTSDNVAAGFATFRRHVYDVVFADGDLGAQSGLDLVDLIRKSRHSPNAYVPIIMLSAHCSKERVQHARDRGVTEILAKPFKVDSVLKRLETVIESPRSFIRTANYFGPDRRRKIDEPYDGAERRNLQPVRVTLSAYDAAARVRAMSMPNNAHVR